MIYGTAHDTLNGHGPGLGYIAPSPYTSTSIDIPITCGIDQSGNAWVQINNQYFSDAQTLYQFAFNNSDLAAARKNDPLQTAGGLVLGMMQQINSARGNYGGTTYSGTMAEIVGQLKLAGVPFTAYIPPPAPVLAPPAPTGPVMIAPVVTANLAPIVATIRRTNGDTYYAVQIGNNYYPISNYVGPADTFTWKKDPATGNILITNVAPGANNYTAGFDPKLSPIDQFSMIDPTSLPGFLIAYLQSFAEAPPPGYSVLTEQFLAALPLPLYGQASPSGVQWALSVPFYTFVTGYVISTSGFAQSGTANPNSMGLDLTKLQAGLYAYQQTDLGQIIGMNWRTYELSSLDIFDTSTGKPFGTFYMTAEGGGGGNWLAQYAPDILRAITDVTTMGASEILDATSPKTAQKVNLIIGGTSIAVISTVATGGALGASIPNIAIAAAGAGVGGAVQGATSNNAAAVITGSLITGAAAGAGAALVTAATPPTVDTATPVDTGVQAGPAAPYTPGQPSILPPGADSTTPTTLVSPDAGTETLSANTPVNGTFADPSAAAPTDLGSGAGVTPPVASTTPGIVGTATKTVETTVGSVIVATGTTALATELKKLTGQLPKPTAGYVPGQAPPPTAMPAAPASGISGKAIAIGVAALALLSKKS